MAGAGMGSLAGCLETDGEIHVFPIELRAQLRGDRTVPNGGLTEMVTYRQSIDLHVTKFVEDGVVGYRVGGTVGVSELVDLVRGGDGGNLAGLSNVGEMYEIAGSGSYVDTGTDGTRRQCSVGGDVSAEWFGYFEVFPAESNPDIIEIWYSLPKISGESNGCTYENAGEGRSTLDYVQFTGAMAECYPDGGDGPRVRENLVYLTSVVWDEYEDGTPLRDSVRYHCTTTGPTDGEAYTQTYDFLVGIDAERVLVTGKLGDVVTVDLAETEYREFEFAPDQAFEHAGHTPKGHDQPANGVGYVARIDDWEASFRESGTFYFVPVTGGVADLTILAKTAGGASVSVIVALTVVEAPKDRAYSTTGPDAVTFDTGRIDVYRQQQRLKYLGFPGERGNQLVVDGLNGSNTNWARGLFVHAIANSLKTRKEPTFSDRAAKFANARNAPRWVELSASTGVRISSTGERWATSWAQEVLEVAGESWGASKTTADCDVFPDQDCELLMNAANESRGGDDQIRPNHSSHEVGMDLDINVWGSSDTGEYLGNAEKGDKRQSTFYRTYIVDGTRYVAAKPPAGETDEAARYVVTKSANGEYDRGKITVESVRTSDGTVRKVEKLPAGAVAHNETDYRGSESFLKAIRDLIFDNSYSEHPYSKETTERMIRAFTSIDRTPDQGARVGTIYFNDPRLWEEFGGPGGVRFWKDHGGHLHVNVEPPETARA